MEQIRRFLRREDGQVMGFLVIVAMAMLVGIFFIYNMGDFFVFLIQQSNAVDAAVISAANAQADCLNNIVEANNTLMILYWCCIIVCFASCGVPFCWCCLCGAMGAIMNMLEWTYRFGLYIYKSTAAYLAWKAGIDAYKASGGKDSGFILKPCRKWSQILNALNLDEVKFRLFHALYPQETYCGLGEKKTSNRFDWAGGKTDRPDRIGSYGGFFDEEEPLVLGLSMNTKFKGIGSWFSKSQTIWLGAIARVYGGHLHRSGPWPGQPGACGSATFRAKLVPFEIKYLMY
ncbi:MAG: hypothetical protein PHF84_06395 [bacterium]|nr:hypothetical protein [bacterium]